MASSDRNNIGNDTQEVSVAPALLELSQLPGELFLYPCPSIYLRTFNFPSTDLPFNALHFFSLQLSTSTSVIAAL